MQSTTDKGDQMYSQQVVEQSAVPDPEATEISVDKRKSVANLDYRLVGCLEKG